MLIIPIAIAVLIALIAFAVLRKIAVPALMLFGGLYFYAKYVQPQPSHEPERPALKTEEVAAGSTYNPLVPNGPMPTSQPISQSLPQSATPVSVGTNPFNEGRSDRASYDAWFSSLNLGPYQDGVVFWASHRSMKVPPSCHAVSGDVTWENGCLDSKARLAPSDKRRRADPVYRSGWNSSG